MLKINNMKTDGDLSRSISEEIYDSYTTALQFINSNPDYSLVKYREIVSSVVNLIAKNKDVRFENENLNERIKHLFQCQLISHALQQSLHEVRKLGNTGAHASTGFDGAEEFQKTRNIRLTGKARHARKQVISILEDIYLLTKTAKLPGKVDLLPEGGQEHLETLYEALTSTCPRLKLKAGVICKTIYNEHIFGSGLAVTSSEDAHLRQLKNTAISFYDASCEISANIDRHYFQLKGTKDYEKIIHRYADSESLFKYGDLAINGSAGTDRLKKALGRIKAVADREYGSAESLYGTILYETNGCSDEALSYLERGAKKDGTLALRTLHLIYSSGELEDHKRAIEYLNRAVQLECPDSIAMLGEVYHRGTILKKDDVKAKEYLLKSIEMGSSYGKKYYIVYFSDLRETVHEGFKYLGDESERMMKKKPIRQERKIGRNSLCHCGSGQKYKKCHGKIQ